MILCGERASVQNPSIAYAGAVGGEYVPPDRAEIMRGGATGILFTSLLHDLTGTIIRLSPEDTLILP